MQKQYITKEIIDQLGINLNETDVDSLLAHLNSTLAERIGAEITEELDDEQLKTLLRLQETASEEEVGDWIKQNVPEIEQIAQDEVDILLGELADGSDIINKTVE
jgi:hypothetical protein